MALQLPLYAMAVERLFFADADAAERYIPWQAGYWFVKAKGYQPKRALKLAELREDGELQTDAWHDLQDAVLRKAVSLISGIREAQFPMHSADDECTGRCPFARCCRVNHARSLQKSWEPPPATGDEERADSDVPQGAAP